MDCPLPDGPKGEPMYLKAWNMSDGNVHIHEARCKHRRPTRTGNPPFMQEQVEFGKTDWPSKEAFCFDYWNNGILEEYEHEHGEGSFDIWQCMEWKPCTDSLQDNEPLEVEEEEVSKPKSGSNGHGKAKGAKTPKPPRQTGHRAYLTKPIPSDMLAYARWIEEEFADTFPDGVDARKVYIALRAYGAFQKSDISFLKTKNKDKDSE